MFMRTSKHRKQLRELDKLFFDFSPDEFEPGLSLKAKIAMTLEKLQEGRLLRKELGRDLARKTLECQALTREVEELRAAKAKRVANLAAANKARADKAAAKRAEAV